MKKATWRRTTIVLALVLVSEVSVLIMNSDYKLGPIFADAHSLGSDEHVTVADDEYIQRLHSIIDAYRGDLGERVMIESNPLIDTKYRAWKRNADIINSLLGLPKGMNDAGR